MDLERDNGWTDVEFLFEFDRTTFRGPTYRVPQQKKTIAAACTFSGFTPSERAAAPEYQTIARVRLPLPSIMNPAKHAKSAV